MARRVRALISGTVQGVGFRPHVYRLATSLALSGWVRNESRGVTIEIEGAAEAVSAFLERVVREAPPISRISGISVEEIPTPGPIGSAPGFVIEASRADGAMSTQVSPDVATCADCLREIFDQADRRYRYPFTNCTNCGPRFTIVLRAPYDRVNTTMAGFTMCSACQAEYDDPLDRRFHAQPNACPVCGPAVRLVDCHGQSVGSGADRDVIGAAARLLQSGAILSIKGIGGFHLACRADDSDAVGALRRRKHREDKPFALMVRDLEAAGRLVELGIEEQALLAGPECPIVLAQRKARAGVADAVAPGHRDLGIMLPYTPLHHLLLADTRCALVMTSGNVSDEPIAYRDAEALQRLSGIADLFLLHNRPIATRVDDSVMRVVRIGASDQPLMLRRSRGFVPVAIRVPEGPPLLATGAELKNTFCVARGPEAWVSHHIGDLENVETLDSFESGVAHFEHLFQVAPAAVAHDLHPDYLATRFALATELPRTGVQHHHAHLAACLAEYGERGPAVGVTFDGTGFGTDGTVWGGEILVGGLDGFERAAHLWPVRLPGGAAAIRQGWRMACSWLLTAGDIPPPDALRAGVPAERWNAISRVARSAELSPLTTSMGRLFDAVAALCGIRYEVNYEGQAAIELEMLADPGSRDGYPFPELDGRPLIAAIVSDLARGTPVPVIAGRFHQTVAQSTATVAARIAHERGLTTVVLSGGVFQNTLLLERTAELISGQSLRLLVPQGLPGNDGGIAYGQVAVARGATRSGME